MPVIATAGHVDHGKSALVRALTGQEPDRLAAERTRGLTLDLGHTHVRLPSGRTIGIVDVPGHERYLGTTVSGIGPAGGVLFCVAADDGWSAQSEQHARACAALGMRGDRILLVLTKTDLLDSARGQTAGDHGSQRLSAVSDSAAARLTGHGLAPRAVLVCSTRDRHGVDAVAAALDELGAELEQSADPGARARLWVDRAFTLPGHGTVVTGTLPYGTLVRGDRVWTTGGESRIRALHRYGHADEEVSGPVRVAVNLAGRALDEVPRGSCLIGPSRGAQTGSTAPTLVTRVPADVALHFEDVRWPRSTLVSFGTTTVMAGLSLIRDGFRLHLPMPQPLAAGDRVLVRDPGGRTVLGGLVIRDAAAVVEPAPQEVSAHPGAAVLIAHLHDHPLCPPEPSTLDGWGIGVGELNALSAAGQILYLGRGLALGINAPAQLLAVLADLPGEFTVSEVRTALGLSRARTLAILEYADRSGLTERLPDGTHRRVR